MIKLVSKTNKILILILTIALLFTLVGCGNSTNENSTNNNDELYSKAIGILEEFSEDQRIKDFLNAYDLLMTLPSNEDKFISQLEKVNEIYEKYDVELNSGSYYLKPKHTIGIDQGGINDYRSKGAYYDASDLLEAIVYPVLFEKYGNEAQSIEGINAQNIISAIKSTNDYSLDKKTEQYDGCKEEWKYVGTPKTEYEVKYHSNGLIEYVTIPIVRSDNPLNDNEYIAFFEKDAETQKQLAGSRFMSMSNQLSTIFTGYEVLSQIFTDEEITIISNYIHSLTIEEIWERNLYAIGEEPVDYFGSIVMFDYKGNSVGIHYNLNDISLKVTGKNYVNPLTHRWYTLWCGLGLPDGESKEETINLYDDYINNNTAYNSIIQDYSFDLDTNANGFIEVPNINTEQTQGNENTQDGDVQQSIPVEMSMSEEITVYGVIEKNNTGFPSYRLRLTPKLTIIFDEYIGEKVFECEYLYFYDDAELNNYFPIHDFVGYSCEVTAVLEDYRGGNELFFLKPSFSNMFPE